VKKSRLIYLVVVLIPLIRTDLIILSLAFMISVFVLKKTYYSIIFGFSVLLIYLTINYIVGNYGYFALFKFTFVGIDPYPRDMELVIQPWLYVKPYLDCTKQMISERHTLAYVLIFYLLVTNQWYKKLRADLLFITVVSCSYAFFHIALFPTYEDRFFAFPISVICIALFAIPLQWDTLSSSSQRLRPASS
jgi:hypothetical protein